MTDPVLVVLTTLDRPVALRRAIATLMRTTAPFELLVQDDGSGPEAREILWDGTLGGGEKFGGIRVKGLHPGEEGGDSNRARRRSLVRAFEGTDVLFVVTIESDCVFHPEWLQKTLDLALRASRDLPAFDRGAGPFTIGGVAAATVSPYRGLFARGGEEVRGDWATRHHTGGVCHLISRWWYQKGKEPGGWMAWEKRVDGDWPPRSGGWDHMMAQQAKREGLKFVTTVPSYVDHDPGAEGTTSGSGLARDRAVDFVGE